MKRSEDILDRLAEDYRRTVQEFGDPRTAPRYWADFHNKWGISPHTARKWISGRGPIERVPVSVREAARRLGRAEEVARKAGREYRMPPGRLRALSSEIARTRREAIRRGISPDLAARGVQKVSPDLGRKLGRYIKRFKSQEMLEKWLRKSKIPLPAFRVYEEEEWFYVVVIPTE